VGAEKSRHSREEKMTALIKTYVTEKKYSSPCFDAAAAVKIVLMAEEVRKNGKLDMPFSKEMENLVQSMNSKESVWFLTQLDLLGVRLEKE